MSEFNVDFEEGRVARNHNQRECIVGFLED